jgi:SAM-dependent methyltransferase
MLPGKLCEWEDFQDPAAVELIRFIEPDLTAEFPNHPAGREHRKSWEHQYAIRGAQSLGALRADSTVLIANAGSERIIFGLTSFASAVFAVDDYCLNPATGQAHGMLFDPRKYAPLKYKPHRLRVQHMNPVVLQFEDSSFDAVFLLQFSKYLNTSDAGLVLLEAVRVLRRGGVLVLVMEMAADGGPAVVLKQSIHVHSPESVATFLACCPHLQLLKARYTVSEQTLARTMSYKRAVQDNALRITTYPHILFELHNRLFTSAVIFGGKR